MKKKRLFAPGQRMAVALKRGYAPDWTVLGYIAGRRLQVRAEVEFSKLEAWFRSRLPQVSEHNRPIALSNWRKGFFNGLHSRREERNGAR